VSGVQDESTQRLPVEQSVSALQPLAVHAPAVQSRPGSPQSAAIVHVLLLHVPFSHLLPGGHAASELHARPAPVPTELVPALVVHTPEWHSLPEPQSALVLQLPLLTDLPES
jgi:hypothetical protein